MGNVRLRACGGSEQRAHLEASVAARELQARLAAIGPKFLVPRT